MNKLILAALLAVASMAHAADGELDEFAAATIPEPKNLGPEYDLNPPACFPATNKGWKEDDVAGAPYYGTRGNCSLVNKRFENLGLTYVPVGSGILREPGTNDPYPRGSWKIYSSHPVTEEASWTCGIRRDADGPPLEQFTCVVSCCQLPTQVVRLDEPASIYMDFPEYVPARKSPGDWSPRAAVANAVQGRGFSSDVAQNIHAEAVALCDIAGKGRQTSYKFTAYWSGQIGHFFFREIQGQRVMVMYSTENASDGNIGEQLTGEKFSNEPIRVDKVFCVAKDE